MEGAAVGFRLAVAGLVGVPCRGRNRMGALVGFRFGSGGLGGISDGTAVFLILTAQVRTGVA
jgi:hypothetical protein